MVRPKAKELTERELEVMQTFWKLGEATTQAVRDALAQGGLDLAYTTVATLVKILTEKRFIEQITAERPFRYRPCQSQAEVSGRLLGQLVQQVFQGSRELLLVRLLERKRLTAKERALLEQVLAEHK